MSIDALQNASLVVSVHGIRRLSSLVGSVQQATVAWVTQQQLCDALATSTDGYVKSCVTSLQQHAQVCILPSEHAAQHYIYLINNV
jgi:hypothetical protein